MSDIENPDQYTLDRLPVGATARVRAVQGDDAIAIRLLEMGILVGESLELVGAAPLGDPLEFRVQGYHLSLRKTEARRVVVEPDA